MEVIEKCNKALASVKDYLSISQYQECHELINKHNECLLGLEFAIDFLTEEDILVSNKILDTFYLAFTSMAQEKNNRLPDLKAQVQQ